MQGDPFHTHLQDDVGAATTSHIESLLAKKTNSIIGDLIPFADHNGEDIEAYHEMLKVQVNDLGLVGLTRNAYLMLSEVKQLLKRYQSGDSLHQQACGAEAEGKMARVDQRLSCISEEIATSLSSETPDRIFSPNIVSQVIPHIELMRERLSAYNQVLYFYREVITLALIHGVEKTILKDFGLPGYEDDAGKGDKPTTSEQGGSCSEQSPGVTSL